MSAASGPIPATLPESILGGLLLKGGVYFNIVGDTPDAVLDSIVKSVRLPKDLDRVRLANALKERESLVPTAIGLEIAIPHPRSLCLTDQGKARVAVCFLDHPVGWQAPDGLPVQVAFLILSADRNLHLQALSELSRACEDVKFLDLLKRRPATAELAGYFE